MPSPPLLSHVSLDKLFSPSEPSLFRFTMELIAIYPHYIRQREV